MAERKSIEITPEMEAAGGNVIQWEFDLTEADPSVVAGRVYYVMRDIFLQQHRESSESL